MNGAEAAGLAAAMLGSGGIGGWLGRWLTHRKSREEAVDARYERLVDELQSQLTAAFGQLAAQAQLVACLQAEAGELRRKYDTLASEDTAQIAQLRRALDGAEARAFAAESRADEAIGARADADSRIAQLEAEVARLRAALESHGIAI